jgi:hypothetical protein
VHLLIVVVSWLMIIFGSVGLFAARNAAVVAGLSPTVEHRAPAPGIMARSG